MTRKDFKEKCDVHQYGRGYRKRNAIYFDWKDRFGYKFMVKASIQNAKRVELYRILYDWVFKQIEPPYYVEYKYASNNNKRFKVSLMG
jgi:hypothetical protein